MPQAERFRRKKWRVCTWRNTRCFLIGITPFARGSNREREVDQLIVLQVLSIEALAGGLRLLLEGGLITATPEASGYVDKIIKSDYPDERKRMLLAFGILNYRGFRTLEEMISEEEKRAQSKRDNL